MTKHVGNQWMAFEDRLGNIEINCGLVSVAYLQGDDATQLRKDLEILDTIIYPSGPFADIAQHIDALLSPYSVLAE